VVHSLLNSRFASCGERLALEKRLELVEEGKSRCCSLLCLPCASVGGAGVHVLAMRVFWRRPRRGFAFEYLAAEA
jgi:hypothetical protein